MWLLLFELFRWILICLISSSVFLFWVRSKLNCSNISFWLLRILFSVFVVSLLLSLVGCFWWCLFMNETFGVCSSWILSAIAHRSSSDVVCVAAKIRRVSDGKERRKHSFNSSGLSELVMLGWTSSGLYFNFFSFSEGVGHLIMGYLYMNLIWVFSWFCIYL